MSVLLLQGPLGPFFDYFSQALQAHGINAHKIHLNLGDSHYYSQSPAVSYKGESHYWSLFLKKYLREHQIKLVVVYGDCRYYHQQARTLCEDLNIHYIALEEGYLRPNYITIEQGGVNGHSPIRHAGVEAYKPIHSIQDEHTIPSNFFSRVVYAFVYYNVIAWQFWRFINYRHHREYTAIQECVFWWRGFFRKQLYKFTQPTAQDFVEKGPFFLVPLQVHNDAQIKCHSAYDDLESFITQVMTSYANSAADATLLIKHHPMDRGHSHYGAFIKQLAKKLNIQDKVDYIHDQHLPTLLKHCEGVVTINSTTALQAFYHEAAVKVMGCAFFDMPGLTDQKPLDEFWSNPQKPDMEFADRFRAYLLDHGQINGSFYCEYEFTCNNIVAYMDKHGMLSF